MSGEKIKVHLLLDRHVYERLWEIVKKRIVIPTKKLHVVVNEALKEYIDKHMAED